MGHFPIACNNKRCGKIPKSAAEMEAFSFIGCLHIFCRNCLVKVYKEKKCCFVCEALIGKATPTPIKGNMPKSYRDFLMNPLDKVKQVIKHVLEAHKFQQSVIDNLFKIKSKKIQNSGEIKSTMKKKIIENDQRLKKMRINLQNIKEETQKKRQNVKALQNQLAQLKSQLALNHSYVPPTPSPLRKIVDTQENIDEGICDESLLHNDTIAPFSKSKMLEHGVVSSTPIPQSKALRDPELETAKPSSAPTRNRCFERITQATSPNLQTDALIPLEEDEQPRKSKSDVDATIKSSPLIPKFKYLSQIPALTSTPTLNPNALVYQMDPATKQAYMEKLKKNKEEKRRVHELEDKKKSLRPIVKLFGLDLDKLKHDADGQIRVKLAPGKSIGKPLQRPGKPG